MQEFNIYSRGCKIIMVVDEGMIIHVKYNLFLHQLLSSCLWQSGEVLVVQIAWTKVLSKLRTTPPAPPAPFPPFLQSSSHPLSHSPPTFALSVSISGLFSMCIAPTIFVVFVIVLFTRQDT